MGLQLEYCLVLDVSKKTSFVWAHYSPSHTYTHTISVKEHEMKPSKHVWAFKCSDHIPHTALHFNEFFTSVTYDFTKSVVYVVQFIHFDLFGKIDSNEVKRREEKRYKTTLGKIVRVLFQYRSRHESLQNMIGNIEKCIRLFQCVCMCESEWVR